MVIGNYGTPLSGKVNDKKTNRTGQNIEKQSEVFISSGNSSEVGFINPGKMKAIQATEVRTEGETTGIPKNLSSLMANYSDMMTETNMSVATEGAGHFGMIGLDYANEAFDEETKGLETESNGITACGSQSIPPGLQTLNEKYGLLTMETNLTVASRVIILETYPYLCLALKIEKLS